MHHSFFHFTFLPALLSLFLFLPSFSVCAETYLTILHFNDSHGHLLPEKEFGGAARFASLVKERRKENVQAGRHVLLLHAGDWNLGSPQSDLLFAKPDIEIFNHLQIDFAALGNHEFTSPFERLEKQLKWAAFPFGSANAFFADGQTPIGTPYRIFEFPECRVGVFGITVANPKIVPANGKFILKEEIPAAREMVRFLREEKQVQAVIAVTHLGLDLSRKDSVTSDVLAEKVPGIDLIVDGHSHTLMREPRLANGTPIVSAHKWNRFLGEAVLKLKNGKVTELSWKSHPVTLELPEDPETLKILAPFLAETERLLNRTLGHAAETFDGEDFAARKEELPLGRLVSDAMVWGIRQTGERCDFAFINGGNLRTSLPKGKVTLGDLTAVLPFPNEIVLLELDGKTLLELFQFLAEIPVGSAAFPQISNEVRASAAQQEDGSWKLQKLTLAGKEIEPEKFYRAAVTDFMADGGDGFTLLLKCRSRQRTELRLRETADRYIQNLPQPFKPSHEKRFVREEKEK